MLEGFISQKMNILKSIRGAIDYNGEELLKILKKPSFKKLYGEMMQDDMLKTSPGGYSQDHRFIDLMRYKSFAVKHDLSIGMKIFSSDIFKIG